MLDSTRDARLVDYRLLTDPRLPTPDSRLRSVRQRIQQRIDAERIPRSREVFEVLAAVALALERVAEVGVVRHHDEDVTEVVRDRAHVRLRAAAAALRR